MAFTGIGGLLRAGEVSFAGKFFDEGEGEGEEAGSVEGFGFGDGVVGEPDWVGLAQSGELAAGEEENPFAKAQKEDGGDESEEAGGNGGVEEVVEVEDAICAEGFLSVVDGPRVCSGFCCG